MTKLEEQFLGKKVRVKTITSHYKEKATFVGICSFIGYNKLLNNKKQITVSKTPLFLDDFNQVSLFTE